MHQPIFDRILIIEDEVDMASAVAEVLAEQNLEIKTAVNGVEGLAVLESGFKPHLVICDLSMPVMDGFEFLKRAFLVDSNLHVIVLTAFGDTERVIKCLRLGCKDYITKPFTPQKLVEHVFANLKIAKSDGDTTRDIKMRHLMRIQNASTGKSDYSDF